MKIRPWIRYLAYLIIISAFIFLNNYVLLKLRGAYERLGKDFIVYVVILLVINVIIGFLFGLEHLISEVAKDGTWAINVPKLILLGLPSLFFSLFYILGTINEQFFEQIGIRLVSYVHNYIPVFQIILGYVIISSFYKISLEESI